MELIDQHTKTVMEGCKERALDAGLSFQKETLEYIVTNRDLLELSPKMMIPTLYDYWVHDVEVIKEKGKYELYPVNPYETVINTRPAISFYNDNNPDWLNVMIFYHVLGHVDFFQNNTFFRHTWDYDFAGRALSDKRMLSRLRSRHGRWVDYVIEFARGLDNLVGFHCELRRLIPHAGADLSPKLDYYFDHYLQEDPDYTTSRYLKEIDAFNRYRREDGAKAIKTFLARITRKHPEFESAFQKHLRDIKPRRVDILEHLIHNSPFLNQAKNKWMLPVLEVVRKTSLFFQPQIRTKIMNEGWASYWHQKLFLNDDRIKGHEVDFARVDAKVTSMPRVGLNPYALGLRLFQFIEESEDKGRLSFEYRGEKNQAKRDKYDKKTGRGGKKIFSVRRDQSDFGFISSYVDQDFVDHFQLFVSAKRLNRSKGVWEYYVKSRKAKDYRRMLLESLYHPPHIELEPEKASKGGLYLMHRFEGKALVKEHIPAVMLGLEFLWGANVELETMEPAPPKSGMGEVPLPLPQTTHEPEEEVKWQTVVYMMKDRKLTRKILA